ncbi:PilC/PilY family type IV pilus protein [Pseudomonas sp.]|uniref:pilus assembly protein n=1 Tax=Pseudomonas sp. TaxID=306 RepID=UPI00289C77A4|nr:PilC/PilY family type IV pilus protein [Pseudomonas sp.]
MNKHMDKRSVRSFLIGFGFCWVLAWTAQAQAASLSLSQQPLFLTTGVAPNLFVTIDNSQSMRWGFMPDSMNPSTTCSGSSVSDCTTTYNGYSVDAIRTSRRAKSSTYNPLYYNPDLTYTPPYTVTLNSDGTVTNAPLSTSFTKAWINGYKTSKGYFDLSSTYRVTWEYDTSWTSSSTNATSYTGYTSYTNPNRVYYLAANPSADFGATSSSTSTTGSSTASSYSASTDKTGSNQSLNNATVSVSKSGSSCTATISSSSSSASSSTTSNGVTTTTKTVTTTSYSNVACNKSGNTYHITAAATSTPVTTTTVSSSDRTTSAVPAYYYVYDTTLSTCTTASKENDNCYKLVTVSDTSGLNGTDERQNFANWYSFYRNRELLAQTSANLAFSTLSEDMRFGWQGLGTSCVLSNSYLSSYSCAGLTSSYDNRLRPFTGLHRVNFFTWLADINFNQGTPLLAAYDRVGTLLKSTGVNAPYAATLGSAEKPIRSCRPSYAITITDGVWSDSTLPDNANYDNTARTLPDGAAYSPMAPYKDSASGTLADLAFKYWATDAQTSLDNNVPSYTKEATTTTVSQYWNPKNDPATWQHLTSFFVGIGLSKALTNPAWDGDTYSGGYSQLLAGTLAWPSASSASQNNVYDLWHAAINGRGEFFSAESSTDLVDALDSIATRITQTNSASASQTSSPLLESDYTSTYTYVPTFSSSDWSGDVTKYLRSTSSSTAQWSSQSQLDTLYASGNKAYSSRKVYMAKSTATHGLASFAWSNLTSTQQSALNKTLSGTADSYGSKRVDYLLGDRTYESSSTTPSFRVRGHVLGDIIDSTPARVAAPSSSTALMNATVSSSSTSYSDFKATWANRETRIYVGANDGMLHAFNDDGEEVFAFIPSAVVDNLYKLSDPDYANTHQYYVDGTPVTGDVYFDGAWHTVLIGTLRGGGRAVFALDITDPDNIKLLWEKSASDSQYSELGFTYSKPVITRLHTGEWGVVLANGYNSTNDKAVLYLMNVADGSRIGNALEVSDSSTTANGLSSPYVADINGDLIADYVYAGDLHGNLWRFDLIGDSLTSTATTGNLKVAFSNNPLYTAKASSQSGATTLVQPITASPYLVKHPTGTGYIVIFGTGKYLESGDAAADTTKAMTIYGVWDRQTDGSSATSTPALTYANLQQQTIGSDETITYTSTTGTRVSTTANTVSSNTVSWYDASTNKNGQYGWYINLLLTGEMVVSKPFVLSDTLIMSSLMPNDDPCESGASTYLYALDPYSGGGTDSLLLGTSTSYSRLALSGLLSGVTPFVYSDGTISLSGTSADGSSDLNSSVKLDGTSNRRQTWRVISNQAD